MPWGVAAAAVIGAVGTNVAANKSSNAAKDAAKLATSQVSGSTGQAREDLFNLFPSAQNNAMQGYQGALDVFKQSVPQQMAFGQSGNVAAQNQLINAMPQYQNAILGGPVDYSQFQATDLGQPNLDFLNQQLSYENPYGTPNPLEGMTSEQIQLATATQPAAPAGTGGGQIIGPGMGGGGNSIGPMLSGRWGESNYNNPQLGGWKSGNNQGASDFSRDLWRLR